MSFYCFFFFKQKTAYEMRISDWSSDVCSSDLVSEPLAGHARGKCDTKGFRQAADTQLDHQIGAMDFYRARRNAEIKSDGFVRQALDQALEDVLLARRERSEEHTSELQSLMCTSYAVFCLTQQLNNNHHIPPHTDHYDYRI